MIETLTGYFWDIVNFFIKLLPSSQGIPDNIENSLTTILTEIDKWSVLIPIGTILTIIAFVFILEAGIIGIKLTKTIITWVTNVG